MLILPQEMKAFEHFPAAVVTDLCRYAEYERLPSKVTCMCLSINLVVLVIVRSVQYWVNL